MDNLFINFLMTLVLENNNELLVKVDLLVSKITELEKQIDTLKNENVKIKTQIIKERNRLTNYFTNNIGMNFESLRRLDTDGPFLTLIFDYINIFILIKN